MSCEQERKRAEAIERAQARARARARCRQLLLEAHDAASSGAMIKSMAALEQVCVCRRVGAKVGRWE